MARLKFYVVDASHRAARNDYSTTDTVVIISHFVLFSFFLKVCKEIKWKKEKRN